MRVNGFYILSGLAWLLVNVAHATDIEVAGLFNGKAMVSINGSPPKVLSIGQTLQNVKLVSASSSAAVFEVDGKKQTLGMGQSISTSSGSNGNKPMIKLTADGGGHFQTGGSVNGRPINFLVDTGATTVAISMRSAQAMGIDFDQHQRDIMLGEKCGKIARAFSWAMAKDRNGFHREGFYARD